MTPAAARARLESDRQVINRWLAEDLAFGKRGDRKPSPVPARLAVAMRYAVLGRAKRIRAALVLETFRAAGGRSMPQVRPFCSGIEMIHAFSLIHDDLPCMDDDDYRRGKASLHRRFDEATAVLTGDALMAYAFELFAASPAPAERKNEALRVIAGAIGPAGMAGGQLLDLAEGAGDEVNRRKTALFMASAVEAGAALAGAPTARCARLKEAGLALGMLFQATDDRLDRLEDSQRPVGRRLPAAPVLRPRLPGPEAGMLSACQQATRTFRAMGRSYGFLTALPELILNRTA